MKKTAAGVGLGAGVIALLANFAVPMLQREEGTRYKTYADIVNVMTVCTGHTGPDVVIGKTYTAAECSELTLHDAEVAASGVLKYSPKLEEHPKMLASFISFSYNVGVGTYARSSVRADFDAGRYKEACDDLLKYDKAGGVVVKGLHNRRVRERELCLSGIGK